MARQLSERLLPFLLDFRLHAWLWCFIGAIAGYDVAFAIAHRDTICEWEANPLMLALISRWGVEPAAGFRLLAVQLGWGVVLMSSPSWRAVATFIVIVPHLVLLYLYLTLVLGS